MPDMWSEVSYITWQSKWTSKEAKVKVTAGVEKISESHKLVGEEKNKLGGSPMNLCKLKSLAFKLWNHQDDLTNLVGFLYCK